VLVDVLQPEVESPEDAARVECPLRDAVAPVHVHREVSILRALRASACRGERPVAPASSPIDGGL
jgi:hypothetical protein